MAQQATSTNVAITGPSNMPLPVPVNMIPIAGNVAGKVTGSVGHPVAATETAPNIGTEALSLSTVSDQKILETISKTHIHADVYIDVESLYSVVQNIVTRSTQTVDNIVQGTQVHVETTDEKPPKASFSSPLRTLKKIGCELSCNSPGEESAHQSTMSILKKLSNYSWEAKAALTLAAFALDYGEFWHLAHELQPTDQIGKSLAILKRVPVVLKPDDLQKRRQAIVEVNGLIKSTLKVIETILDLEKSPIHIIKNIPDSAMTLDHIPVDVFWAIITIVACATKIDLLISDEGKPDQDLSTFSQKIQLVLNNLKKQQKIWKEREEEEKAYENMMKIIRTSTKIVEVLKALIVTKDKVQPLIIIGHTNDVPIDDLSGKYVLLFLSSLDVSDDDINVLKPIHEAIKKENKYCIVWIPIVEKWTDILRTKFNFMKTIMPWYIVQSISSVGIRFIKEEWDFKAKSTFVKVMDSQGKVIYPNALHKFRLMGIEAFSIWDKEFHPPPYRESWIETLFKDYDPNISTWIREEKYIFFYGGKDEGRIQLLDFPILKEAKIDIKMFCVGKSGKGEEDPATVAQFWTKVESMFFSNISHQHYKQLNPETQEVQRLLSYKNEAGWALLCKGSTVVTNGRGSIVLKVMQDFEKWKDQVVNEKSFAKAFKDYYNKLNIITYCCRIDFTSEKENIPVSLVCTECSHSMETLISFKCCHIDGPLKEHR